MEAGERTSRVASLGARGRAIQHEAAEWLALRQARPLTAPEEAAFTVWCTADPRHVAMLGEVETAYRVFDRLAFYPRRPDRLIDPDLLVHRRWWRTPAPALLACAAAVAVVAIFWLKPPAPSSATPAPPPMSLAMAGSHFLRLSDGSRVELHSDSIVAEDFTAAERRIRLVRGEAHFEVAKNARRPFIVEAGTVSVRAVGTAFDVRLGASAVDVLVTEGKVGVTSAGARLAPRATGEPAPAALGPGLILVAGQRTAVPTTASTAPEARPLLVEDLTPHQIDRALAWQNSRLVFDAMPLAEVVARFNRSAKEADGPDAVQLKVTDADLAALRISGRIRYDSIENFVEVLEADFGVTAERHGAEIILHK